jgi:hypothetical protein
MRRVLVMGCSGSGKTTFARSMAEKLAVPYAAAFLAGARADWKFPAESRPQIFADIERFGGHLNVFRLCHDRDVAEFSRAGEAA